MKKVITLGDKEIAFKSSAATNILFKRTFREDITLLLQSYTKDMKELKVMQAKIADLRADETKTQEEVLAAMGELMQSEVFIKASSFQSETLPKLAFIMHLEATETVDNLFNKLNESEYLIWLMTIDQNDLSQVTSEVMDIWRAGAQVTSKPKNANG